MVRHLLHCDHLSLLKFSIQLLIFSIQLMIILHSFWQFLYCYLYLLHSYSLFLQLVALTMHIIDSFYITKVKAYNSPKIRLKCQNPPVGDGRSNGWCVLNIPTVCIYLTQQVGCTWRMWQWLVCNSNCDVNKHILFV